MKRIKNVLWVMVFLLGFLLGCQNKSNEINRIVLNNNEITLHINQSYNIVFDYKVNIITNNDDIVEVKNNDSTFTKWSILANKKGVAEIVISLYENNNVYTNMIINVILDEYLITYDYQDSETNIETIKVSQNSEVILIEPIREGYRFIGWFEESNQVTNITTINRNYNLVAKWEKLIPITYNLNGGFCSELLPDYVDSLMKESIPIPNKDGYKFVGWYVNNVQVVKYCDITSASTLKAYWEKIIDLTSISLELNNQYYQFDTVTLKVKINPSDARCDLVITSSDNEIVIIDTGKLEFVGLGKVIITIKDTISNITAEKEIEVIEKPVINISLNDQYNVHDIVRLTYTGEVENVNWSASNDLVKITNGVIFFLQSGKVTINAESVIDKGINASIEIDIKDSQVKYLVQDFVSSELNDEYIENKGLLYIINKTAFTNLDQALNAVSSPTTIILNKDINSDVVCIKNDVRIIGPGYQVQPTKDNKDLFNIEISSTISFISNVNNIEIHGLSFTNNAKLKFEGGNSNIKILNNYIHDTTINSTIWSETASYNNGIILFDDNVYFHDNINIENNYFSNLGDMGVLFSKMENIKIINNTFDTFSKDAIRSSNGIPEKCCQWLVKNNKFINGAYNGIMFRTFGSDSKSVEHIISVYDNYFRECGKEEVDYSGAISFRTYQEGTTTINISYNTFEYCNNYIILRNNAEEINQNNFTGYIMYNSFLGIPKMYYLKNVMATDTKKTNPDLTIMKYNVYMDNDGVDIDINSIQDKFNGCKENNQIKTLKEIENITHIYGKNTLFKNTTNNLLASAKVVFENMTPDIVSITNDGIITPIENGIGIIKAINIEEGTVTYFEFVVKDEINIDYIKELLTIAIGENGYKEGYENDTKYGDWYGLPNQAWCAMFVSWCSNQAGISTSIIPRYASVSAGKQWFINKNLFHYKEDYIPVAGDIIFFTSDGASHTGIVIKTEGDRVYTIEGNTSDMVALKNYPLTRSVITGYGTPNYPLYSGEQYVFDVSGSTDGSNAKTD